MIAVWAALVVVGLSVSVVASGSALRTSEALGRRAGLSAFVVAAAKMHDGSLSRIDGLLLVLIWVAATAVTGRSAPVAETQRASSCCRSEPPYPSSWSMEER